MLEEVNVDLLFGNLHIRLDVISEDLDIQNDAVLGERRFDVFENLGVRNGRRGDAQMSLA